MRSALLSDFDKNRAASGFAARSSPFLTTKEAHMNKQDYTAAAGWYEKLGYKTILKWTGGGFTG